MTTAREATFYDQALDNLGHAAWLPVERTPYRDLYERTAALVPLGAAVVELGCGTGRLASLIEPRVGSYLGLDFAARRIEEARRYAPGLAFEVADVRERMPLAEVYVANELLEHLDDDLGLIGSLPAGAVLVFSVPSFDAEAHVRHFPTPGKARERYGTVVQVDHEEQVPHGYQGRFFHLMRGTVAP